MVRNQTGVLEIKRFEALHWIFKSFLSNLPADPLITSRQRFGQVYTGFRQKSGSYRAAFNSDL